MFNHTDGAGGDGTAFRMALVYHWEEPFKPAPASATDSGAGVVDGACGPQGVQPKSRRGDPGGGSARSGLNNANGSGKLRLTRVSDRELPPRNSVASPSRNVRAASCGGQTGSSRWRRLFWRWSSTRDYYGWIGGTSVGSTASPTICHRLSSSTSPSRHAAALAEEDPLPPLPSSAGGLVAAQNPSAKSLPRFRDCARNRWPFGQFG